AEVWLAWRARSWAWARLIGSALFVLVLVVGALGYGTWRLPRVRSRPGPLVGLVQANIPQEIKNRQRTDHIFLKHWETTQELRGAARGRELDLIVWPESMVQLPLNRSGVEAVDVFRKALINIARMLDVPLLVGAYAEVGADNVLRAEAAGTVDAVTDQAIVVGDRSYPLPTAVDPPTGERPRRRVLVEPGEAVEEGETLAIVESIVHNSAFLVRPDRGFVPADRYDKNHLVPFGEYVPLQGLLFFLGQVVPYGKGFTGSDRQNLMEVAGTRFGVLICFEDVFPYLVQDYVVREGGGADFLINISNDGWFQGTHELDQHLAMCRLRAIEFRTGIVRCCNTGISAIIDPRGDLQTVIEDATGDRKEVAGVAVGRVRLRDEITAYARHGDVLGKACLAAAVLILLDALIACLRARLRRRRCKDGVCEV
ncbi:MAG: apolipoprotein N-acyltransferase, partial [Planctomycetota bacterium]